MFLVGGDRESEVLSISFEVGVPNLKLGGRLLFKCRRGDLGGSGGFPPPPDPHSGHRMDKLMEKSLNGRQLVLHKELLNSAFFGNVY